MAGLAGDAGIHVRTVVEVNVIRQGVNPLPMNGPVFFIGRRQCLDARLVGTSHFMAVHTGLGRWHTGKPGSFSAGMTVKTRDLIIPCVQLMGKINGLIRRNAQVKAIRFDGPTNGKHRG
jgi:hypothetical protein